MYRQETLNLKNQIIKQACLIIELKQELKSLHGQFRSEAFKALPDQDPLKRAEYSRYWPIWMNRNRTRKEHRILLLAYGLSRGLRYKCLEAKTHDPLTEAQKKSVLEVIRAGFGEEFETEIRHREGWL